MARRVTAGVRPAHVVILSLAAGVAAAYLTTPILIALHALGVRVPMGVKVVLVNLDAWGAWWLVRRMLIDRQLTGAVSRAYPKLFCPCGYCLLGLPPSTLHCPECGVTETG